MNTIKFNNVTCELITFNKNTYFTETGMSSNVNCQIKTTDVTSLYTFAQTPVESIQIYHDSNLIYELNETNGRLTSIDEYLADDRINITINLNFDVRLNEETTGE